MEASLLQMRVEQRQNMDAFHEDLTTYIQPLLAQIERMTVTVRQPHQRNQNRHERSQGISDALPTDRDSIRITATMTPQQCTKGCRCRCHARNSLSTPPWLRSVFGQLMLNYNTSISIKACDVPSCRKSVNNQHFTYYFPRWLLSRAVVASANLDGLFGAGAKIMVNVPLIVPEEEHIVWSYVIAGNTEQLRQLLSRDKNLMYVRNQWGQSIMHVSQISVVKLEPWASADHAMRQGSCQNSSASCIQSAHSSRHG